MVGGAGVRSDKMQELRRNHVVGTERRSSWSGRKIEENTFARRKQKGKRQRANGGGEQHVPSWMSVREHRLGNPSPHKNAVQSESGK